MSSTLSGVTVKRSYGDPCGVARALDLVGERWALLVVRELLLGPKRFTDLRVGLPHLSPDVLSQRLRDLEQAGVLHRAKLPPPAASRVYVLTDRGKELEPVILALGRFGSRSPFPATDMPLGADALVVALKTLFNPPRAHHHRVTIALQLDEHEFSATVADGRLDIARGTAKRPDATIKSDPATFAAVLWHDRPLERSSIRVNGDARAVKRFLRLFPPPQPATDTH